mmetsp:Transcript_102573/g.257045  ORF Transcript_102573/g.257045 Transcript_102573/m.257045 type:complete len:220 (+) Transcript_102573:867-1526(+)
MVFLTISSLMRLLIFAMSSSTGSQAANSSPLNRRSSPRLPVGLSRPAMPRRGLAPLASTLIRPLARVASVMTPVVLSPKCASGPKPGVRLGLASAGSAGGGICSRAAEASRAAARRKRMAANRSFLALSIPNTATRRRSGADAPSRKKPQLTNCTNCSPSRHSYWVVSSRWLFALALTVAVRTLLAPRTKDRLFAGVESELCELPRWHAKRAGHANSLA